MVRLSFLSSIAAAALLLPVSAAACDSHAKAKPAPEASKAEAASDRAPTDLDSATLLHSVDVLVADKCSCKNAADCTCKKGQCKCKGCKPRRLVDPVKGTRDALRLPADARHDASSGVFI